MNYSIVVAAVILFFGSPLFAQDLAEKIAIKYPEGWKIARLPDGRAMAEGPDEGGMHATISVGVIPVNTTPLKDLLEPNLKTMAKLPNFSKQIDEDFTIEGQKGRKIVFKFTTAEKNIKMEQAQYWVVINQTLYLIDCSCAEVSFEKCRKIFDDVAKTLSTKGK